MKPPIHPGATVVTTLIGARPAIVDGAIGPVHAATQHAPPMRAVAVSV
ncbi:hypothetical protein B0G75_11616 [Paraburkholderia sp. BL18I3N2]|nr:hypothetical protein [Paraburkholderia sp. BL18I3N2]PRX26986.1 hypothetical protein B0G75_11616 [Paraburkholderia sp. BL18I3N2]